MMHDRVNAPIGPDVIGTAGNDSLTGTRDSENLLGASGNDTLFGAAGQDSLFGQQGDDLLIFSAGDSFDGGLGTDILKIDFGAKTGSTALNLDALSVTSVESVEVIMSAQDDRVVAGAATFARQGSTVIEARAGFDVLNLDFRDPSIAEVSTTFNFDFWSVRVFGVTDDLGSIRFAGFESVRILGSQGNDLLAMSAQDQLIFGFAGNDTLGGLGLCVLYGGDGNDVLSSGPDTAGDVLSGGNGYDKITSLSLLDSVAGGSGFDRLTVDFSRSDVAFDGISTPIWAGVESVSGTFTRFGDKVPLTWALLAGAGREANAVHMSAGTGRDTLTLVLEGKVATRLSALDFSASSTLAEARLISTGVAPAYTATLYNFEDFAVSGTRNNDTIEAWTGNDHLIGLGGDDVLKGWVGSDTLEGGAGNDRLYSNGDTIGRDDIDWLYGGSGNDVLQGGVGHGNLYGGSGDDNIYASSNASLLEGGDGFDLLRGSSRADSLYGGADNDLLMGQTGADTLSGGTGADVFAYTKANSDGRDLVVDFSLTEDRVAVQLRPAQTVIRTIVADGLLLHWGHTDVLLQGITTTAIQLELF